MAAPTTTSARAADADQGPASLNEPSMEDILASIRRIIAEDQSHGLARGSLTGLTRRSQPAEPPVEARAPAADMAPPTDVPATTSVEAHDESLQASQAESSLVGYDEDPGFAAPEASAEAAFPAMEAEIYHQPADEIAQAYDHSLPDAAEEHAASVVDDSRFQEVEPLMSPVAGASITSSFQALAESMVLQDPGLVERVMRETMRPLLKEWLDDHLPSIVERLVRSEIERVARGGRSRD